MFDFLSTKFSSLFDVFKGKSSLKEADIDSFLTQIQEALLEADVPYAVIKSFCAEVKTDVTGKKIIGSLKPQEQLIKVVNDRMVAFLGGQNTVPFTFTLPSTLMLMGLQGSGKTTTAAKLAALINKEATQKGKTRTILLASVDFYRPAAIDQLQTVAQKAGVSFYRASNTNPVKAAQEIYAYAQKERFELLFLDTAGRLHVDNTMLQELREIDALLKPKNKFLVLDAMTGQESLAIAQAFDQGVGFDGAILTKMDSDTRGGAAFAFRYALKKPIHFIGVGEKIADFERFFPERIASRILGMGDLASLMEKANEQIKQTEQEKLQKAFTQGRMTLQDFADQLAMVKKMGSLGSMMSYIPGMATAQISPTQIQEGEVELKKFGAIISSMTQKERVSPSILDASRKKRIATGAGVTVPDINTLLTRFEESQQFVKLMKKFNRFSGLFGK